MAVKDHAVPVSTALGELIEERIKEISKLKYKEQYLFFSKENTPRATQWYRKNMKKLLLAVIAVVIVAKIARDIMKARKQKENIPADIFEDFYEEEMNWWDKDLEEGEEQ